MSLQLREAIIRLKYSHTQNSQNFEHTFLFNVFIQTIKEHKSTVL